MIPARRMKQIWAGSVFAILFLFGGLYAHAATKEFFVADGSGNITCTNPSTLSGGGVSCNLSGLTMTNSSGTNWHPSSMSVAGVPVYLVANSTDTTGSFFVDIELLGSGDVDNVVQFSGGSNEQQTVTPSGVDGNTYINIGSGVNGGNRNSDAVITYLCLSTVSYADCAQGGGGGGGGGSTASSTPYDCIKDGSSSNCLIQVVDNPTLDYMSGVVIFMGTAYFIIWVFRRRSA